MYDVASRALKSTLNRILLDTNNTLTDILESDKNSKVYVINYGDNTDNTILRATPNKDFEYIHINSMFDYCDVVNSVDYYLGINSGSSLIASSIKEYYNKKLKIFYWTPEVDGGNWNPPNVELIYYNNVE